MATAPATAAEPRTHGSSQPDADDASLATLDFGRYAGWQLRDIAKRDIEYLMWLRRHASGARFRPAIDQLVRAQETAQRPARARR